MTAKQSLVLTRWSDVLRIIAHVSVSDGCWTWTGKTTPANYGRIYDGKTLVMIHRLSWSSVNGSITPGYFICHRCDNPPCVRPDHLFMGTVLDNTRDAASKGRLASGDRNGARLHPERLPRGSGHQNAKLTEEMVRYLRRLPDEEFFPTTLASEWGISATSIRYARSGKMWRHVDVPPRRFGGNSPKRRAELSRRVSFGKRASALAKLQGGG